MLHVDNVSKYYGSFLALDQVSFQVQPGEILGLLGRNGAGKSTLMRIMTGFFPPSGGTVTLDDDDIREQPGRIKLKLGYLPEQPPLYMDMIVAEYVRHVAELRRVPRRQIKERVEFAIEACQLEDRRYDLIETLSKGYRQRTALAGALVNNPRLLVLDEPFVGLDPVQAAEIKERVLALREDRMIVFSSHVLHEVERLCDRVVIVERGRRVGEGSTDDVRRSFLQRKRYRLLVPQAQTDAAASALSHLNAAMRQTGVPGELILETVQDLPAETLTLPLQTANIPVLEYGRHTFELEEVFRELASRDLAQEVSS